MSDLKPVLETQDELRAALEGLHHLPADALTKLLLTYYTVDLDMLSQVITGRTTRAAERPVHVAASSSRQAA
ncbi:hypothetical protein [Roseibium sp.]|uniref:hypothetical protein n=1 Tax=Roseibium sp. TaxID=1936156 RepID=UPI003A974434